MENMGYNDIGKARKPLGYDSSDILYSDSKFYRKDKKMFALKEISKKYKGESEKSANS